MLSLPNPPARVKINHSDNFALASSSAAQAAFVMLDPGFNPGNRLSQLCNNAIVNDFYADTSS